MKHIALVLWAMMALGVAMALISIFAMALHG